jgi:solute carrier family 25 carnitine/acylcarnitine transporter 20/29
MNVSFPTRLLTTPIELIKIQQQKQQQQQHLPTHEMGCASPTSARAVALHVYRQGGIRALYCGLSATIWRDVGGYGLYFYGVRACVRACVHAAAPVPLFPSAPNPCIQYEGTLRLFTPARPDFSIDPVTVLDEVGSRPWAPLLAGAAAGVIGWIATFPFDVLKTRLQAGTGTGVGAGLSSSSSSSSCTAREMYAESGGRVFWRGLVPTLVRAVPVNMAVFGTFEGVVWAFSRP